MLVVFVHPMVESLLYFVEDWLILLVVFLLTDGENARTRRSRLFVQKWFRLYLRYLPGVGKRSVDRAADFWGWKHHFNGFRLAYVRGRRLYQVWQRHAIYGTCGIKALAYPYFMVR